MSQYQEKIKQIKEMESKDVISFQKDNKKISLRLVDDSDETVRLLLEWRMKYWDYFDTKFEGNYERTRKWIKEDIIKNPNRILFLIFSDNKKIGHIGIDHYDDSKNLAQIQNVLLGTKNGLPPNTMEDVLTSMFEWMFDELGLSKIQLNVFSDNFKAINLYEKCQMVTINSIPLKRNYTDDGWKWEELKERKKEEYPERWFNLMEISKEFFLMFFKK